MAKLFLLRHLKSEWNLENRFSGWTDMPIANVGKKDAKKRAKEIFKNKIDLIFTSPLFRNLDTVVRILEAGNQKYPIFIPRDGGRPQWWGDYFKGPRNFTSVYVVRKLNERHYGNLEGLDKQETIAKYGEEKVHAWRRSWSEAPPKGESLRDVYKRATYFYKKYIWAELKDGKNVLIVSSHNPLRAIVKYIEDISNDDIAKVEIDYGGLTEYHFDKKGILKNKMFS